jgi:type IX secretion system PorP/SprF family membrane protein
MSKNINRIALIFTLVVLSQYSGLAQQYPLLTNYMTNVLAFNPGVAGTDTATELKILHRSQWVGIDGAPQTSYLTINGKLKADSQFGIGGYIVRDGAASLSKTGLNGVFSVHKRIGETGLMSLGATVGFYNIRLTNSYTAAFAARDATIQNALLGAWAPDLGVGLFYKDRGFWAGASIPQIYQYQIIYDPNLSGAARTVIVRHYYVMAGYKFNVVRDFTLEPSFLMKYVANVNPQFDISLRGKFSNNLWIGASYRTEGAIVGMAGYDFDPFKLAYAYDSSIGGLQNRNSGSHEISLSYTFGK